LADVIQTLEMVQADVETVSHYSFWCSGARKTLKNRILGILN
jgi:hypothetical protein